MHGDAKQALSSKASTPLTTPHLAELLPRRQPGFIGQSLYIDAIQASLDRASIPTPTRPHQAKTLHRRRPGLIGQRALTQTPTRPHRAEPPHRRQPGCIGQNLYTNANHASLGRANYFSISSSTSTYHFITSYIFSFLVPLTVLPFWQCFVRLRKTLDYQSPNFNYV